MGADEPLTAGRLEPGAPVLVLSRLPVQRSLPTHRHPHPLVLWSDSATVVMQFETGDWVMPPGHGVWIPADTDHGHEVQRRGAGGALAVDPARCPVAWPEPTAFVVEPLWHLLIHHLDRMDVAATAARRRAEGVLFDLLTPAPALDLPLPIPTDDRLRLIADALLADPADGRGLDRWAGEVGAGVRTLSRLFTTETGMTFREWRTRARIRAAIDLLARGTPVAVTARRVGYARPAAFSQAFRRVTGQPPSSYGAGGA